MSFTKSLQAGMGTSTKASCVSHGNKKLGYCVWITNGFEAGYRRLQVVFHFRVAPVLVRQSRDVSHDALT
jgi:hypothetical protein